MARSMQTRPARRLRPAPPPLEANDQAVIIGITAAWAVALITLLILRDQLPGSERWWIWACLTGFCLGLFGIGYVPWLKRSRTRAAVRRARQQPAAARQERADPDDAG